MGAALRLWAVQWARFTGDEASFWETARALAALERFPMLGPEVTGTAAHLPGPFFHWVTAIPQLLGTSPYLGGWGMALLHVAAGAGFILAAHRARGPRAAGLAWAVWVFAPWDVLYGDRVWASCLAPALGAGALYGASSGESRRVSAAVFLCVVMPQVHLSAPILWASVATVLILRAPPGIVSALARGTAAAALTYLPFLVLELRSGFANTRALLDHAGGSEASAQVLSVPRKVFGYGLLYSTGELSYQFARGYWGGGFDEGAAYGSMDGWSQWLAAHGSPLALLVLLGILLAGLGWAVALRGAAIELLAAGRSRRHPSLEATLSLAIVAGLVVGSVLMMASRKAFYPHYANILMPFALWPTVAGLDRLMNRGWFRPWVVLGLAASMAGMGWNTVRYYLQVDGLNGLRPTMAMVNEVIATDEPAAVRFTHFRNTYAWQKLASGYYRTRLRLDDRAYQRFVVHNRVPSTQPSPFAPARMEQAAVSALAPPKNATLVARKAWPSATVRATGPGFRTCMPHDGPCRYGSQPWQRFEPDAMAFDGALAPVLFFHPATSSTVSASFPVPSGSHRGTLWFGLSDEAQRSTNHAPVELRLFAGLQIILQTRTSTQPGLRRADFSLPSGAVEVRLELNTRNDGARVFGFDLWLTP